MNLPTVFTLLLLNNMANGLPLKERSLEPMIGDKNEKVLPNGTVVGHYQYMDKDGYPVEVKYYADKNNYGVEMNSVKVIQDKINEEPVPPMIATTTMSALPSEIQMPDTTTDILKYQPYSKKNKFNDPILELLNRESAKPKHRKLKHSLDYETYMLDQGSKHCNKDMVRVYNVKPQKRKLRNAPEDDLLFAENACNRF